DYHGAADAERVVLVMGSGHGAVEETVDTLVAHGERVGVVNVRLYRPFSAEALAGALPLTVRAIGVLDRTKEPGAPGEPLYQDVVTALTELASKGADVPMPKVIGGRYGLASKEFDTAMAKAVFDELAKDQAKNHFTVGIVDDVSHTSLEVDRSFTTEPDDVVRAVFYGLGADGTVSANKSSVKIIGEGTDLYAQGYFVYDSKKSGSMTTSHLRFGQQPIRSTYLIGSGQADFVACHQFGFLERLDVLDAAAPGAIFLLNSPFGPETVWDRMPVEIQRSILEKRLRFYVVDAQRIAAMAGLGPRVNTILQTCFFALVGVLDRTDALGRIKAAIEKSYGKRGRSVVEQNFAAVDAALDGLREVRLPTATSGDRRRIPPVPKTAPDFVQRVTAMMIAGKGDLLPVSALPVDGTFPTDTARWEDRSIANEIPIWDPDICIDCAKCALVCPHAAIRMKVYEPIGADHAPAAFRHKEWRDREDPGRWMTIQVVPDDCTGCGVCVDVCPARSKEVAKHKAIDMEPKLEHLDAERAGFDFFLQIPPADRRDVKVASIKGSQMLEPLFGASGACAGCGETPYLKLLSQMYGDRILVANATGCSSIYGGNLPTTPWSRDADGRGPAWSNSLFEDNAEFGLGMRLALDHQAAYARSLLERLGPSLDPALAKAILDAAQDDESQLAEQRDRIAGLKRRLDARRDDASRDLLTVADALARKTVWIVGGDGWAYDIGFGGLDHVLASGRDVNVLVLDTQVYSNTGGQASKATPRGAVAKFAAAGKPTGRKDLGLFATGYGDVYVAQVALGADNAQTVKAFAEAESWPGPSLIIAYSTCIAHGIDMSISMSHQTEAARSGFWPLWRYDPRLAREGRRPMQLDSRSASQPLATFQAKEARFAMLARTRPQEHRELQRLAQADADERRRLYEQLAGVERDLPGRMPREDGTGSPEMEVAET
ncbi:MAG TPA: pyruvate:ferredoxin (flavodoxin) oxidoreductase, partial [Actinomycetota bacterium]|nr:pyruvate:ferredoxin (flavodoxin) oxidoreductase [Actinomycetota bacterium]